MILLPCKPSNLVAAEDWETAYQRFLGLTFCAMKYQYVNYLWDDAVASKLDPVERLVYRSNILGSDQRITNTGGGNTSAKILEQDPLTGEKVEVLWVKGSGGDLRTSKRENFASLYQQKLIDMQRLYASEPEKGAKTPAEDKMVGMYTHATFNLNPRASSIDTPLHSFIPFKHVDHMHPNAAISVAAAKNSKRLTDEIYGNEVIWTPWLRPGFELGLEMQRICAEHPEAKGVILGQHGLINWANDDKECYELTLYLIEKAAQYIEARYEEKGRRREGVWRAEIPGAGGGSAPGSFRGDSALAARPGQPAKAVHRHHPGRRKDFAFRQFTGRRETGGAWHQLPGSFSAHQDQTALRRLGSAKGRCGDPQIETAGRPREVSGRLRGLLQPLPATGFAGDARSESDGDADSRPGDGRLGQRQIGIASDRGILQLRGRSHARLRSDR